MRETLSAMDHLLESATEQGREPQHWIMRKDDWLEIGEALRANLINDPTTVGSNTYRGVPVHFTNDDVIVGLMTSPGDHLLL